MNKRIGNRYIIYYGGSVLDRNGNKEIRFIDHPHILSFLFDNAKRMKPEIVDMIAIMDEDKAIEYIQQDSVPITIQKGPCIHKLIPNTFENRGQFIVLTNVICTKCGENGDIKLFIPEDKKR